MTTDDGESPRTHAMVLTRPEAWHYGDHYRVPLTARERAEMQRHGFVTAARRIPVCTGFVLNRPRGHRNFPQGNRASERSLSNGKSCTHGCYDRYCRDHLCRSCRNGTTRPEMAWGNSAGEGPEWFLTQCAALRLTQCAALRHYAWEPWQPPARFEQTDAIDALLRKHGYHLTNGHVRNGFVVSGTEMAFRCEALPP